MSLADTLFKLYATPSSRLRSYILRVVLRLEGGELYSTTARRILKEYHKVDVGMYTQGACVIGQLDKYTTVGRFCSFSPNARVMNRNHPMNYRSMHALFFNPVFKQVQEDSLEYIPLVVGHDVWLGHNAIIMPSVKSIGTGAVVGAGAVVNKDIPPYGVVVGNPARVVRYRFSKEKIEELLESKWWEKSLEELAPAFAEFTRPFEEESEAPQP